MALLGLSIILAAVSFFLLRKSIPHHWLARPLATFLLHPWPADHDGRPGNGLDEPDAAEQAARTRVTITAADDPTAIEDRKDALPPQGGSAKKALQQEEKKKKKGERDDDEERRRMPPPSMPPPPPPPLPIADSSAGDRRAAKDGRSGRSQSTEGAVQVLRAATSMPPPARPPPGGARARPPPPTTAGASLLRAPPPTTRRLPSPSSSLSPSPSTALGATLAAAAPAAARLPRPRKAVILTPGHSPLDWARLQQTHPNLRNLAHAQFLRVTPRLLRRHNGRGGADDDVWAAFGGKVYNITPYLPFHPGGVPEIMRAAGRDGTTAFLEAHPWVSWETMLRGCLVGMLVGREEGGEEEEEDD
ncbi:MAG: hypothetical protein M1826_001560 [Phylliscum demangeonii]|nr:MAG: hypothetical protein M1826_001560 [Phylliscum demangeonii]